MDFTDRVNRKFGCFLEIVSYDIDWILEVDVSSLLPVGDLFPLWYHKYLLVLSNWMVMKKGAGYAIS